MVGGCGGADLLVYRYVCHPHVPLLPLCGSQTHDTVRWRRFEGALWVIGWGRGLRGCTGLLWASWVWVYRLGQESPVSYLVQKGSQRAWKPLGLTP